MNTLTVNIDNKKSEKAIKAVLEALGLDYNITPATDKTRPLNKAEQRIFNDMKNALEIAQLYKKGEIKLKSARELLDEL